MYNTAVVDGFLTFFGPFFSRRYVERVINWGGVINRYRYIRRNGRQGVNFVGLTVNVGGGGGVGGTHMRGALRCAFVRDRVRSS